MGPLVKYVIKGTDFPVWMNPHVADQIAHAEPHERFGGWATFDGPRDQVIVCAGWIQACDGSGMSHPAG